MQIYLEGIAFLFYFSSTPSGDVVRKVFRKAEEGKVTIVTSAWSMNQFIDELIFVSKGNEEEMMTARLIWRMLEREEEKLATKNKFLEVGLTTPLLDSSLLYVINGFLTAEQALHVFSAKLRGCDAFLIGDERFVLNKERWKDDFDVYHLSDENDRNQLANVLNKL